MPLFEHLDGTRIGEAIRRARERVLLCVPGFDDHVGTALVDAHRRLPSQAVQVIVDGSDHAARLGYGYFAALKEISDAGVPVRIERGVRIGLLLVDDDGWVFTSPPLLIDVPMEESTAPNAMGMTPQQVAAVAAALMDGTVAEAQLGSRHATAAEVEQNNASLIADPPQRFDVARKVNVFNAFIEFVELELQGTQLGTKSVSIPPKLLLSISDEATRDRLTANFQLIGERSDIARHAKELRQRFDAIRKTHTRPIKQFGSIGLRANRPRLEQALEAFQVELESFRSEASRRLQKEIDRSRKQLVESVLPAVRQSPPSELLSSIIGAPKVEHMRRWIEQQLDRAFPSLEGLLTGMSVNVAYKGVTYETLKDPTFQQAVRDAYPMVDFDKPFREFTAARGDEQPDLTLFGR